MLCWRLSWAKLRNDCWHSVLCLSCPETLVTLYRLLSECSMPVCPPPSGTCGLLSLPSPCHLCDVHSKDSLGPVVTVNTHLAFPVPHLVDSDICPQFTVTWDCCCPVLRSWGSDTCRLPHRVAGCPDVPADVLICLSPPCDCNANFKYTGVLRLLSLYLVGSRP